MLKEACVFIGLLGAWYAGAAEQGVESKEVVSHVLQPQQRKFSEELLSQLKTPDGFKVNVFARNLGNARWMLPLPDGTVLVTRFKEGDVLALRDKDNDGTSDEQQTVAKIPEVHGLAIHDSTIYLASTKKLWRMPMERGRFGPPQEFATLPDGGQHPRRTIGFGPDGMLFVSIGSTCNACQELMPEHAAMVRMKPDGSARKVFARGLRNTIGFAWHPETREFWGMDHGSDHRGDNVPSEELNRIVEDADYGWPFCYESNQVDLITTASPEKGTKEEHCAKAKAPALMFQAHMAPIGFVFYTGDQFPAEYRNDAFVSFRGSWNRKPAAGYKVMRVRFKDGQPVSAEDFLASFLIENGQAHFGRLAGLAVANDGSLLLAEDTNGIIYRISATGR